MRSEERARKRKLAEQHAAEATQSKFFHWKVPTFLNSKSPSMVKYDSYYTGHII